MYKCKEHGYTLKEMCNMCGKNNILIKLPKFSLEDKHGEKRRQNKFLD
jgi:rRNA maturation protein Nop10